MSEEIFDRGTSRIKNEIIKPPITRTPTKRLIPLCSRALNMSMYVCIFSGYEMVYLNSSVFRAIRMQAHCKNKQFKTVKLL